MGAVYCRPTIILSVQRRTEEQHQQQQQQASLFLHLSLSTKCLYLGISQWKLALRFIPFSFLIMGCRPVVCLSSVAAPLTNSTDLRWSKKRGKEWKGWYCGLFSTQQMQAEETCIDLYVEGHSNSSIFKFFDWCLHHHQVHSMIMFSLLFKLTAPSGMTAFTCYGAQGKNELVGPRWPPSPGIHDPSFAVSKSDSKQIYLILCYI